MHGWGDRAAHPAGRRSDVLQVNQGSLYPALHRLEEQGWIEAEWGAAPSTTARRSSTG